MGIRYLWDTNTAIYYLQQQFPSSGEQFIDQVLFDSVPVISVVTEIELMCRKTDDPDDLQVLHDFIAASHVIELDQDIKNKTAELRKASSR